tara:strand:- start:629 stop:793 length:165 start_codon:yes stop_codon:yes gene_type:complete
MKNQIKRRKGYLHLYNPQKEGLGSYDVNYINAYRKNNKISKDCAKQYATERLAS